MQSEEYKRPIKSWQLQRLIEQEQRCAHKRSVDTLPI